ncbi:FAD-binding oxidoreductase [Echinimonas agarilytica]|uniref:D-2-hydroxyglutarate dehydrogenase n=2 Tax=Echinimonas agarilytica TaxID=1215918 RepID=A0AA42B847_9GAMM|nr:FAD-binding and (Fe-S)-binding domain-containing protein [Echinimonas agarilytica]MCM2680785.1 FAD-binding oxidoreductase [Echinimonas agarilytica]
MIDPVYQEFLEAAREAGFEGDIETSYSSRLVLATDNSVYQQLPQAAVFPKNIKDVQCIARTANQTHFNAVRFSARGGGTGTNGQSLTPGLVVDLSRYMNQVLEVNADETWVTVQGGLVKDRLNDALRPHGYFFAPDLSTSNRATVGGMINTDASGQGSLVYGKTSDHLLAVKAVLADGSLLETSPVTIETAQEIAKGDSTEAGIYRQVLQSCTEHQTVIDETFPPLNRFLTGYDLKHAIDWNSKTVDIGRLIAGSEGSLAFVCEAKFNITPIPKFRTLVNVKYASFEAALRNAPAMVEANATSVETVDSRVLNLAREDVVWHSVSDLIEDVPGKDMQGLNMVEYADKDELEHQSKVETIKARLEQMVASGEGGIIGYQMTHDLASINAIYGMRKKAVGLLGNTKGRNKPIAFAEDTCVPPENLADFIMEFRALLDSHELQYGMFGHVDAGVLHVRPAMDMCDPEQEVQLRKISDQVVALTAKYRGLMWGEHGKGYRSEYGPEFFGETLFSELRKIKAAFDPLNQMNPGKITTPFGSGESLVSVDAEKRGAYDRQIPVNVRDSFTQSVDCNGNGLCFNYDEKSPMCPSFKITQDRRHSPKGRAGLMREWLRQMSAQGVDPTALESQRKTLSQSVRNTLQKWKNSAAKSRGEYDYNHEVMDAMKGCLACKACTTACPISVDVPTFRARFMNLYYQKYQRPFRDYMIAGVEDYTPLMAKMPRFTNAMMAASPVQWLMKQTLGMVDAPLLSYPTLKDRLRSHPALGFELDELKALSDDDRKDIVLIVQDPFTTYYDAQVVDAMVRFIAAVGKQPVLLPFKPNGKPQHVKGFLEAFAKTAKDAADLFNQLHDMGLPMIGTDPSLVMCYRDEYAKTLGAERGDFHVMLLQEWLMPQLQSIPKQSDSGEQFTLFAHCTEKSALPTTHADWQTIFSHFGGILKTQAVGCCGMAGTYGHEIDNRETTEGIYNLSWATPIKEVPQGQVLTTGYSCRSQVKRFEGYKPKHPVEALLALVQDNN